MASQETNEPQIATQDPAVESKSPEIQTKSNEVTKRGDNNNGIQLISLLNFNPHAKNGRFLNSPRSIQALKRLCLEDHELLVKKKEDFYGSAVPAEFADDKFYFYEVKAEHHEKRRQEKVKLAIQERQNVIEEEKNHPQDGTNSGHGSPDVDRGLNSTFNSTAFFGNEKKRIQQMKNQQKKEIDLIIQNEMRLAAMQKKNEDKVQRMLELEQKRHSVIEEKQRIAEEGKRKREMQRQEKEREDEELKEMLEEKHREEEARRNQVQERLKVERALEALEREKERKEKNLYREKKMEEIEIVKKEETEKKMDEREQRFARIKQEIDEKQKRKQIQSELARRNFDIKIDAVRQKFEMEKEEQRRRVLEKQRINNSRREKFEEEKHSQLEERRNRSEIKIREIKCSLEEKYLNEQAKKMAYLNRYQQAEENKKQKDFELEQERKLKAQRETEKLDRAKHAVTEAEAEKTVKGSFLLKTITEKSNEANGRRENNIKTLKKRYIMDILKMEDTMENNKRLEKMRDNKTKAFLEKISINEKRLKSIEEHKVQVADEKRKLQSQLETEKAIILKDFEKKKKVLLAGMKNGAGDISVDIKNETPSSQPGFTPTLTSKTNSTKYAAFNEVKSATRSTKNVGAVNLSNLDGHHTQSATLNANKSFAGNPLAKKEKVVMPAIVTKKRPSVGKESIGVIKVKSELLKKQDILPSEIQNQEYNKSSTELRREHLVGFLKALDNAMRDDRDEKKIDTNVKSLITAAEKDEGDFTKLRAKHNFLLLA